MPHHRHALLICLTILIAISATTVATAQPSGARPVERRIVRESSDVAASLAEPTDEAKQAISLTLWTLTLSESEGPEADELEVALRDKAKNLPTVVGTLDDIRDLVGKLKVAGLLKKHREIRLSTVDGQIATAKSGADQPSVVGTNVSDSGVTNMLQMRAIGTTVRAIPKIDDDGLIQVGLEYNCSHIEKSDRINITELTDRKPLAADVVQTTQVSTLVRLKSGNAVVVSGDATLELMPEDSDGETQLIILAAEIVD